jgi:hypothetical protein
MTNLAKLPVYAAEMEASEMPVTQILSKPVSRTGLKRKPARGLSLEDQQIVVTLHTLKHDLECLHNRYDHTNEPLLLDSITYEIKAANTKYRYYLHLCKEKGILGSV